MLSGRNAASAIPRHALRVSLQEARKNLNKTAFFGISDYWNTTVCLFHKELNGPGPRPSEYLNVRKGATGSGGAASASALTPQLSLTGDEWGMLLNATRYDRILYNEALQHFKMRSIAFGCPLVPSSGR